MKRFIVSHLAVFAAAFALLVAPARPVVAQQAAKPVVVLSINNLNELFGDIAAITELAGQGDFGRIAVGMGGIYTGGLDKSRPAGVIVTLDGVEPKVLGFVPVTNLKQFLGTYREQIGSPKDAGNGVLEIGGDRPQPIYVKEQQGWAFIAQSATQLQSLPKDPVTLLGGLEKQYDLALQLNISAVPAELRNLAVSEMKQGYQNGIAQSTQNLGPEERRQAEMLGEAAMKSMVTFVEEADQLTYGFAIDSKSKKTFMELSLTAREGSQLAKSMSGYGKTPSNLHGFIVPGSAATFIGAAPLAASDVEQVKAVLKTTREQAMKGIDNDAGLPNAQARDAAKDIVSTLFDVLGATMEKGKVDAAGSLTLGERSLGVVGGLFVADGDKVEAALKKLVGLVGNTPDFPEVKFNTGTHAGVNLHKVILPIGAGEQQVRDVFGEKLEVILGTAKDGLYLALGKDGESSLRKSLDASAQQKGKPAPASELQVALSPILKFASSVQSDPQLAMAAAASEKFAGKDHLTVNARSIDRGVVYRLEIEEGIVQFVGEAVKAAQGGAP